VTPRIIVVEGPFEEETVTTGAEASGGRGLETVAAAADLGLCAVGFALTFGVVRLGATCCTGAGGGGGAT
jgi:hypothetical protein